MHRRRGINDILHCGLKNVALEKELSLEALLQHGEDELSEFSEFLKVWIEYLGKQKGVVADRLFLEAVGLCNDTQEASNYAKKFATVHPALYPGLLEHPKEINPQKLADLGEEALKQIPETYIIRSRIALKTAEYRKNLSQAMGKFDLGKSISWDYGESGQSSERTENKPGRNESLWLAGMIILYKNR